MSSIATFLNRADSTAHVTDAFGHGPVGDDRHSGTGQSEMMHKTVMAKLEMLSKARERLERRFVYS
jgi:hypothetical protein